jgi:hypothetical protein
MFQGKMGAVSDGPVAAGSGVTAAVLRPVSDYKLGALKVSP